jgi:hypothetical protein
MANKGEVSVKVCTCTNEGQDSIYGKGKRLHNIDSKDRYVCTVCRKTDGAKGKSCVRKHPSKTKRYQPGDVYTAI